jgi:hypothetical protein
MAENKEYETMISTINKRQALRVAIDRADNVIAGRRTLHEIK